MYISRLTFKPDGGRLGPGASLALLVPDLTVVVALQVVDGVAGGGQLLGRHVQREAGRGRPIAEV